ncbi:hypothetical protein [Rhabdothermincola sediminis]|uniref:hypothetical protein n=1 Tax=Rhabdothermincola sediminis TaxID=2751370 RepID=UPI001AA08A7E|nr:hypothetical protein [Rhabdothermincola sediminis]
MEHGPAFEDLYDEATLSALDGWAPGHGREPSTRGRVGRGGLAGVAVAGMVLGARNVLDGLDEDEPVVELRPDGAEPGDRWVTFVYVPGLPARSRIVVRPWLAPGASGCATGSSGCAAARSL